MLADQMRIGGVDEVGQAGMVPIADDQRQPRTIGGRWRGRDEDLLRLAKRAARADQPP
jgi:hypothetical protein